MMSDKLLKDAKKESCYNQYKIVKTDQEAKDETQNLNINNLNYKYNNLGSNLGNNANNTNNASNTNSANILKSNKVNTMSDNNNLKQSLYNMNNNKSFNSFNNSINNTIPGFSKNDTIDTLTKKRENYFKKREMKDKTDNKNIKNSEEILFNVLDKNYSKTSLKTSQRKPTENTYAKTEECDCDCVTNNIIINTNESIVERNNYDGNNDNYNYNFNEFISKATNLSFVGENPHDKFIESFELIMISLDPIFYKLSLNEKVEKFLENTEDPRRLIRLGALVGIYLLINKYKIEEYSKSIIEKILYLLQNYEYQEELFLVACLEILSN